MTSYSAFSVSNAELDMLLLSSPMLTASQHQQLDALPPPLQLPPFTYEPLQSQQDGLRRRSNSTMAMLMGADQDELRCRYPSKLCRNTRVRKASGALHRYCAHHRDKANANQKRWVGRQRNEGGTGSPTTSSSSSAASPSAVTSPALTKYRWIMAATPKQHVSEHEGEKDESISVAGAATLSDDDWNALLSLLAPPQTTTHSSAFRCEHRRRAASSPMLPTFATKEAMFSKQ